MKIKKDILWRIGIVYLGMVLLAVYILFQMLKLQIIERSYWEEKEGLLKVEDVIIDANRGAIMSDDGRVLSCSVPGYQVYMDTRAEGLTSEIFNSNIDSLCLLLSRIYRDKPASEYKRGIKKARAQGNRYYKISNKRVSIIELKKIKKFPIFRLGTNKGGFIAVSNDSRKQPFGSLAARTVGKFRVDLDSLGQKHIVGIGLEAAYNEELMGKDGIGEKTKIGGRWVHDIEVEPEDGNDILTTLNIEIQDVAEQTLRDQLIKHNAKYGVAIVMEVETGDIKAMVNLQRTAPGRYVEDHFNYAIGVATEPGSTFKLASLMVALEDGKIKLDEIVDTEDGTTKYYDRTMRDSEHAFGKITIQEAFEKSSNVGISKIIYKHYKDDPEDFIDGLYDIGLNEKLGIELPGEPAPLIKTPDDELWSGVTLPWMSIGYETRFTPLQILTFYNAIANDGCMVKPRFVKGIYHNGDEIESFDTEVLNSSICSGRTLKKARKLLEGVVENGTAMNLKNKNYRIAGKTGTAQIAKGTRGYKVDGVSYSASFTGYFPAEDPMYSCIVVVNGPSNNVYYGNVVAGSVFKAISDRLYAVSYKNDDFQQPPPRLTNALPYSKGGQKEYVEEVLSELDLDYDDKSSSDWVTTQTGKEELSIMPVKIVKNLVPNVKGLGARDAVSLLEGMGLRVQVNGIGKVTGQSINPGTRIQKGSRITLTLG